MYRQYLCNIKVSLKFLKHQNCLGVQLTLVKYFLPIFEQVGITCFFFHLLNFYVIENDNNEN